MRAKTHLIGVGKALAVAAILLWSLVPIAFIVVSSIKPGQDIFAIPPRLTFEPTFQHYLSLWSAWRIFFAGLINSLVITAGATVLAVAASAMAGYAYSRYRGRLMTGSGFYLIAVRLIPPIRRSF